MFKDLHKNTPAWCRVLLASDCSDFKKKVGKAHEELSGVFLRDEDFLAEVLEEGEVNVDPEDSIPPLPSWYIKLKTTEKIDYLARNDEAMKITRDAAVKLGIEILTYGRKHVVF